MLKELQELRALHDGTPTTVINNNTTNNNNTFILNFGQEDMSYLRPAVQYLERTFEGMRELLNDVYFNDERPQNHTIRINMSTRTAEAKETENWKPIELPAAITQMLDKCIFYMVTGYNGDVHKYNDDVMDFTCSLGPSGDHARKPIKAEIYHKLLARARQSNPDNAAASSSNA